METHRLSRKLGGSCAKHYPNVARKPLSTGLESFKTLTSCFVLGLALHRRILTQILGPCFPLTNFCLCAFCAHCLPFCKPPLHKTVAKNCSRPPYESLMEGNTNTRRFFASSLYTSTFGTTFTWDSSPSKKSRALFGDKCNQK